MATIRDVAKLANVSTATVSRVLNNNGYVNSETKNRVNEAIEKLQYRPNDVARSLFKGSSKMIALFVPDIKNPFFPELARAVEDVTNQHNYTFILCNTDDNHEKEVTYLNALTQKSVDGFIIVSSTITEEDLHHITSPVISLDRKFSSKISSVTVNNRKGAREATAYLQSIGCKKIAHISGPQTASNTEERLKGYLDVVEHEAWFNSNYVVTGDYRFENSYEIAKQLLTNHNDIDGVFVANDLMAVGVLKAAESLHIKIPEQLSVIGFDGITIGLTTTPSLTTIQQPIYEIGSRAAQILLQLIDHPEQKVIQEELEVTLIERDSTKRKE
ncbi:LacI family DNA-binding transcriptional regulator [Virgibacillus pantothenticus]|uniref:LacI family DNA-binding transcriptional regulator n=1 Tax=Virgibacillus pantothenticus TaxID=1473 RepID=UPI0009856A83|nr:LacI family DNA-binding transcriptional regulator [Virgibacillus pantothenticus]